jgi:hypothetical protein
MSTRQTANSTPIRLVKRARWRRQAYGPPRGGHGSFSATMAVGLACHGADRDRLGPWLEEPLDVIVPHSANL